MMRLRIVLIVCVVAAALYNVPARAQQGQEQLAAYYFDHGEYSQAAQLYETLYGKTSNKFYYQRLLATYTELGEYKDAVRLVERRIKNNPKDLYLHVDLGSVYLRQKQEKKALKAKAKADPSAAGVEYEEVDTGSGFLTVLAVIIAVILVILLAVILILQVAPDSGIAIAIDTLIENLTGGISAVDPGNGPFLL